MKRIKVHIECSNGKRDVPQDLAHLVDNDWELREGYINPIMIKGFYPNGDSEGTIIHMIEEDVWRVSETTEQINQLINQTI